MKKKTMFGIYLLILLTVPYAYADTHPAASCSYADVRAAVSAAADGDVVSIPACSSTSWASTLAIGAKAITLQGAGVDSTNIRWSAVNAPLISADLVANKNTIITGFTFTSDTGIDPSINFGAIGITGDSGHLGRFRIHHNKFNALDSRTMIAANAYGLYDNNTVVIKYGRQAMEVNMYAYGGGMYGDNSWKVPYTWGTGDAVFIEDNNFSCSLTDCPSDSLSALDAVAGARVVFRYNNVTDSYITNHGADTSGRLRSSRVYEIYNNTFLSKSHERGTGVVIRGGTGLIYNNTFSASGTYGKWTSHVQLIDYRSLNSGDCASNSCFWQSCQAANKVSVCSNWTTRDPTTCASQGGTMLGLIDNPTGSGAGYPCLDQVGRGYHSSGIGTAQANIPFLIWNNSGSGYKVSVGGGPPSPDVGSHIQSDRDYCQSDTTMPTTCNSVNTNFAAYTYPHPLRNLSVSTTSIAQPTTTQTVQPTTPDTSPNANRLKRGHKVFNR